MGIIQKIWLRWRKVDPHTRREIKENGTWITVYLLGIPLLLYGCLMAVYDIQTKASLRLSIPEQVNDKNYQKWLKKQQSKGKFLDKD